MKRHVWTEEEITVLVNHFPHATTASVANQLGLTIVQVYTKAYHLGLRKTHAFLASERSGRIMRGRSDPRMVATQFKPGLVPWNKGVSYQAGGRCKETQFKPGQKPHTTMPVGSYRVTKDSSGRQYLEYKFSDAPGNNSQRWKAVHRIVWEAAHGEVPQGHIVAFKQGMHSIKLEEITADRLECISRKENARRNHPVSRSPELAKLVQLKGAITRQVNRINKQNEQQRG